jgi:hypothetical protein
VVRGRKEAWMPRPSDTHEEPLVVPAQVRWQEGCAEGEGAGSASPVHRWSPPAHRRVATARGGAPASARSCGTVGSPCSTPDDRR